MTHDEEEIRQLITTWMEATKSGDTGKVLERMTEDVVFLVPGRPPMQGRTAFAAATAAQAAPGGARPQFDGTSEIQEVQVLGDWAFLWTRLRVVVTPPGGGPQVARSGHTLSILRKEGGRWLLARDANLLAPEVG